MASAAQETMVEESRTKDCYAKRMMPKCTLESTNALCCKKIKMDEPPTNIISNPTTQEIEYESAEDEMDQWAGSLSTAIDERLSTLQLLLPQGRKMEGDEVLRVLVEYVKELESKIKMFNSSSSTDGCAKLVDQSIDDSPLQRRGLCIMPLWTLAKAL